MKNNIQNFFQIVGETNQENLLQRLRQFSCRSNDILVIDGTTIATALLYCEENFMQIASASPAVVCSRVSPTQKTAIVEAISKYSNCRVAAIGDGGNDVGMIQAAHVGIGIVGKEGQQASLAADFSVNEFKVIEELILWHGRLSYKRTAKLGNFVFHRGLIISVI